MPDGEQILEDAPDVREPSDETSTGGVFSRYGIASVLLGLLCVAAVARARGDLVEAPRRGRRAHLPDQCDAGRGRLDRGPDQHEQGQHGRQPAEAARRHGRSAQRGLRGIDRTLPRCGAEAAVARRRAGSKRWPSRRSTATSTRHPVRAAQSTELPPGMAARTDTVMLVATSVSQNAGGQPQTVRWNLRLDVSDVDGGCSSRGWSPCDEEPAVRTCCACWLSTSSARWPRSPRC